MPYIHGTKQTPPTPPTTSDEESSGNTSDAEMKKKKGNRAMGKKKFPKALKYYSKAMKIDPKNPTYVLNRAIANSALELWKDAEADAERSVELMDPAKPSSKGFYQWARARLKRGQCRKALEAVQAGLKVCPGEAALLQLRAEIERAVAALEAKEEEERRKQAAPPVQGPAGARALLDQGRAAYEAERWNEARSLLEASRAAAREAKEQLSRAAETREILKLEISALSVLAKLYMRRRAWPEAAACFQEVVDLEEPVYSTGGKEEQEALSNAYNNLGIALKNAGRVREAADALGTSYMKATNGDDQVATAQAAQVLQNMGQCLLADRRPSEARAVYQRALEVGQRLFGPDHASHALSHLCLARAARAEGQLRDALMGYTRALEIWKGKSAEECLAEMPELPSKDRLAALQQQCQRELAELLHIAEQMQARVTEEKDGTAVRAPAPDTAALQAGQ